MTSLVHLLMAAASLSALAGGTWSIDRAVDRFARISEAPPAAAEPVREEEEDPKLLY
jgi:hypothetical protein